MIAYYSISNKELTFYSKNGCCIAIVPCSDIREAIQKYGITDNNLYITL